MTTRGVTLPDNLPWPGDSEPVGSTPQAFADLAYATQQALTGLRNYILQKLQRGLASNGAGAAVGAGGVLTIPVTFPYAYAAGVTPVITCTLQNGPTGTNYIVPRALLVSNAGFTIYLYNVSSATQNFPAGILVAWSAGEPTT